jgi:hypothetical protein
LAIIGWTFLLAFRGDSGKWLGKVVMGAFFVLLAVGFYPVQNLYDKSPRND